ncbi:MAG: hypothetical protein V1781_02740 [Bacteroidota bacterium]
MKKIIAFMGSSKNWFRHCDMKRSEMEAISNLPVPNLSACGRTGRTRQTGSRDEDCFGLFKATLAMTFICIFRTALIFLLFAFNFLLPAQHIWYFGNGAGLDFASGIAKPIYDGKLFTLEGCAIASDEQGKLLFYTDGITVWDKRHNIMQNGENLNGSHSSTQSVIIVQQPPRTSLLKDKKDENYFLFTVDEKAGKKGLCYSVINISAGKGIVTKKNIQLIESSTEKLTAVQHANGKDVWIITHQWNSNCFFVFPVTSQGIGEPIISAVGLTHAETGAKENREAIGYLRASCNGKKLASAICYREKNNFSIFNFDKSTGKISDPVENTVDGFPYGLCFSPDDSKLYISFLKGKSGILQYDLANQSMTEISLNEKNNSYGSLQLAPDGKIYVARPGSFLDAIESPNEKGIFCKYTKGILNLSPASIAFGLPNLWQFVSPNSKSFDCNKIIENPFSEKYKLLTKEISVCENKYILDAKNFGASFNWSTLETTQKITVDTTGIYRVAIIKNGCTIVDSIRIKFKKDLAVFRYLPLFNPENEFINSEFYYDIDEMTDFNLKVFDSNKKYILFETKNSNVKWSGKNLKGKIVPTGEYYWEVKYKPKCPKGSKEIIEKGKVSIIRKK